MDRNKLLKQEIILLTIGLIMLLIGLSFLHIQSLALPLTGIGGSILATVIANWIFIRQWRGLPIPEIAEALAHNIQVIRTKQEAVLTFSIDEDKKLVKVYKTHVYSLVNPNKFLWLNHKLTMFTDASIQTPKDFGGFLKVVGPDGKSWREMRSGMILRVSQESTPSLIYINSLQVKTINASLCRLTTTDCMID